jgi:hypothetical protein
MQQFIEATIREASTAFLKIDLSNNSFLQKTIQKLNIVTEQIQKIETTIEAKPFKSQDAEIEYFKIHKPQILRYLIYFQNIIRIEQHFPIGTKKQVKAYLKKEQISLSNFYRKNRDAFIYARCNQTHLDHVYFTKSHLNKDLMAAVHAAEMLQEYLKEKRKIIATTVDAAPQKPIPVSTTLKWTDSQAGLVEIIYSIHAKGCLNDGKATIKKIKEALSKQEHQFVSVEEFCSYTGLKIDQVQPLLLD